MTPPDTQQPAIPTDLQKRYDVLIHRRNQCLTRGRLMQRVEYWMDYEDQEVYLIERVAMAEARVGELENDGPGTIEYRMNWLAEFTRREFGRNPISVRGFEVSLVKGIEVLKNDNAALREQLAAVLKPVTDEESFHFEDEVVMNAVTGTEYLKDGVRRMLVCRTSGEKWSLYRAIFKLAIASRLAPRQPAGKEIPK